MEKDEIGRVACIRGRGGVKLERINNMKTCAKLGG
jgi:hypothetical protein